MSKFLLETKNLKKSYEHANGHITLFDNLNIKIKEGDLVALSGPSGSGKSSLLYLLALLDEPTKGVISLNKKIGSHIETFIKQSPLKKPFARQNWLIHGDTKRFHLNEEDSLETNPSSWFIRSEKETICRFHEDFSLFTINVIFQPLSAIHNFPKAKKGLQKSLDILDANEVSYFGGTKKINLIKDYLRI